MKLNKITLATGLILLASTQAYSHGYVESPASRALLCKEGKIKIVAPELNMNRNR